jgi:hypothetical protein
MSLNKKVVTHLEFIEIISKYALHVTPQRLIIWIGCANQKKYVIEICEGCFEEMMYVLKNSGSKSSYETYLRMLKLYNINENRI